MDLDSFLYENCKILEIKLGIEYGAVYEEKIETGTLLFKKVMSDFEREFDKVKEKGRGRVAKGFFGPTFDGVRDNKDSIKRKALFLRKRERAIIIH